MKDQKEILAALSKFYLEKPKVIKNLTNPYFKSLYADVNSVFYTVEPLLTKVGIIIIQCPTIIGEKEYLNTKLVHIESGQFIESNVRLLLPGPDMQKLGGAITYARRYALVTMLNLEQEDDDGNATRIDTPASAKQVELLSKLMQDNKVELKPFLEKYGLDSLSHIGKELATSTIDKLIKKGK